METRQVGQRDHLLLVSAVSGGVGRLMLPYLAVCVHVISVASFVSTKIFGEAREVGHDNVVELAPPLTSEVWMG